MIIKKIVVLFCSIFFLVGSYTVVKPYGVVDTLRLVKQKFVKRNVTRDVTVCDAQIDLTIPADPAQHSSRLVIFENNLPQYFEILKEDPQYAEIPNLIDQTIIVNGQEVAPGTSAQIMVEDNRAIVTIRLYKGCAKLIFAMMQGPLRSILVKLLKHTMEPWLQWQYKVACNIRDLDYVQLIDVVLNAYEKSQKANAVGHRFSWMLLVELLLNETIDL
jgi:hypothetical protein